MKFTVKNNSLRLDSINLVASYATIISKEPCPDKISSTTETVLFWKKSTNMSSKVSAYLILLFFKYNDMIINREIIELI